MRVWGITGWKNSGKTGLVERLVAEFTRRGLTVSTIKHAHHSFDIDHPGRDSFRHRDAGAKEVLLSSEKRWALMHETNNEGEASLDALLKKLAPCDLVLVEGFKHEPHPKIETYRGETEQELIAHENTTIRAIASDTQVTSNGRPVFNLDDTLGIADFISTELDLRGFDSFAVVDWSSGNDTGPKPKKDAIWAGTNVAGSEREPVYLRNRDLALDWLADLIAAERADKRRLLIGFDFPFGYPAGFAHHVTGSEDPLSMWHFYREHLIDTPQHNNRFAVASELNARFPGIGPFWFKPKNADLPDLPLKGRARRDHGMKERRKAEELAKGAFACWQMGGAGAVGGQVMTGMAVLQKLRERFPTDIAVWPFQQEAKAVHFVEIWPTLIDPVVRQYDKDIRDRAQVRLLTRALANLRTERLTEMMTVNAPEEGWILGLGHEDELQEAACQA
ncbi:MAG: molybdopterin-guanine dinucleotide biosynthesis protein B [Pseudomonadota bacterium]